MTHFNESAKTWDSPEKYELSLNYANKIKAKIPHSSNMRVIEFGTGTGNLGAHFMKDASFFLGVDTSFGMLDVFNEKFNTFENVQSKLIDLTTEELQEKDFDLFISSMAFHHVKDNQKLLQKIEKIMKPGSNLAIIDLDKEDGSFHPEDKREGVFHSGFSKEEIESWSKESQFKFTHYEIAHTFYKNDKAYPIFLAIFKKA